MSKDHGPKGAKGAKADKQVGACPKTMGQGRRADEPVPQRHSRVAAVSLHRQVSYQMQSR